MFLTEELHYCSSVGSRTRMGKRFGGYSADGFQRLVEQILVGKHDACFGTESLFDTDICLFVAPAADRDHARFSNE